MDEVSKVSEYIELVNTFTHNFKSDRFYFRGHSNEAYKLLPSVFRPGFWDKEEYLYHEIMVRCPGYFEKTSHLDKLVRMQHYGIYTRLLDITANPLVALYFACLGNNDVAGKVFMFTSIFNEVVYSDSDRALILSCLPLLTYSEKMDLYNETITRINEPKKENRIKFIRTTGDKRYASQIVEKLYLEICTELPSFKRELNPDDLIKPIIVQPNKTNDRILKQDGAFIINGLSKDRDEAEKKLQDIVTYEIRIIDKEKILNELDSLCINEAALFPEVDKVAEYLINTIRR